jgi:S-adenosylmethionine:tRNA ribosyltransferase-isomerase
MTQQGFSFDEVTLHVGAGTFLPVKSDNAAEHPMHTEHFEVRLATLENLLAHNVDVTAVGTTSVRTLESLPVLGWRIRQSGEVEAERVIGQWESYDIPADFAGDEVLRILIDYMRERGLSSLKAATQIMITPLGFKFRIVSRIVTNFHQPKSTLLLLVSAYIGDNWRRMYRYALDNEFRFLSYGDSSLLIVE